ncbi:type II toxin-antitoxin system HicA family toxin [bacterium]|nr:type II toxin-antitoxin system HicA family toxin [bacterium]
MFEKPTRSNITWSEMESLFTALDAEKTEGRGSRVSFVFKNEILDLHKPHPKKELKKYAVEIIREFLERTLTET